MDVYGLTSILVPIFVCVVLPVAIVLIVFLTVMNSENKRAQVLIKAIEANNNIDADKLAEALQKPKKTPREQLNLRLLRGCVCTALGIALGIYGLCIGDPDIQSIIYLACAVFLAIGVGYLVVFFLTRKQVEK